LSKEVSVRPVYRLLAGASSTLLATAFLTGCSVESTCTPLFTEGSASLVLAEGEIGSMPTVDFPTPLVAATPAVATISEGAGRLAQYGDFVDFDAVVVTGENIEQLTATAYQVGAEQRAKLVAESGLINDALLCQQAGSRFALTGTLAEVFGPVDVPGVLPNDAVVVVVDVDGVYRGAAWGTPQLAQDGMPAVTSAPNGRPGIALPPSPAPTDLRISTLMLGDGPAVTEGQTVVAHYTGILWDGTVFDSSWNQDVPVNLVAQSFIDNDGVGVIPGFAKALVGQTVGSRVVVSIPASEGYPEEQWPQTIPPGATLVFVVDILGVK
jgi:peptidylprolyl isomerase